jgi:hypothetical protein
MLSKKRVFSLLLELSLLLASLVGILSAQESKPPAKPDFPRPPKMEANPKHENEQIRKLADGRVLIGPILVDVNKKEISVPGRMQRNQTLEFLASAIKGNKLYESAIELDTSATSFNLALIMIGLEKSNAVVPTRHFDPKQAVGDPVEIWVEWREGTETRKVRPEELLYDLKTKAAPKLGAWVYTGSTVLPNGKFRAEMDGVLIGFVHDPSSIIENSTGGGLNAYGSIRLNPNLKFAPFAQVKLTIKAIPKSKDAGASPKTEEAQPKIKHEEATKPEHQK